MSRRKRQTKRIHRSFDLSRPLSQKFEKMWRAAGFPSATSALEGLIRTWIVSPGGNHQFALAIAYDSPEMRDIIDAELYTITNAVLEILLTESTKRRKANLRHDIVDVVRERASARHISKQMKKVAAGLERRAQLEIKRAKRKDSERKQ